MPRFLARTLALATAVGGLWAAEPAATGPSPPPAPAPAPLPPLSGELAGQLALPRIPGFPPFAWKVQLRPAPGSNLAFEATGSAPGVELHLDVTLPRGDAPGTWRVVSAKIDAASWWRFTADLAKVTAFPPDFEFIGQLSFEGAGEWRGTEASGTLHVVLSAGSARSSIQNWSAQGLAVEADVDVVAGRPVIRAAHLRVETLQAAGVTAHAVVIEAAGAEGGRLAIERAELTALGGAITLAPFTLDPAKPVLKTAVEFPNIALADVVPLLPQALKEAQGRVAGRVVVEWNSTDGLVSAEGRLATMPGETAVLRLATSSGLFTGRIPGRIGLFLGLSMTNPAVPTLRRVELGEDSLLVERMNIELFSLDGANARTAQVTIVGRPTDDRDVKHINLTVNVTGPLNQVLRLGVGQHATLQVH